MHLKEDDPFKEETAQIFEEILKQRIEGIKNEAGVCYTSFPEINLCIRRE